MSLQLGKNSNRNLVLLTDRFQIAVFYLIVNIFFQFIKCKDMKLFFNFLQKYISGINSECSSVYITDFSFVSPLCLPPVGLSLSYFNVRLRLQPESQLKGKLLLSTLSL